LFLMRVSSIIEKIGTISDYAGERSCLGNCIGATRCSMW
jgi:hypothetical protein